MDKDMGTPLINGNQYFLFLGREKQLETVLLFFLRCMLLEVGFKQCHFYLIFNKLTSE